MTDETAKKEPGPDELRAARATIASLLRGIKMYTLYPENHENRRQAVDKLHDDMCSFLEVYGTLTFEVERDRLLYRGEVVYEGAARDGDLVFSLFRDGVRWLELREGLENTETEAFLRILFLYRNLTAEGEDDIVTALWEAQLPHLHYEAAESVLEVEVQSAGSRICDSLWGSFDAGIKAAAEGSSPGAQPGTGLPVPGTLPAQGMPATSTAAYGQPAGGAGPGMQESGTGPRPPMGASAPLTGLAVDGAGTSGASADMTSFPSALNEKEAAWLQLMVHQEEALDPSHEVLDMLLGTLEERQEEEFYEPVLEYLREDLKEALAAGRFDLAMKNIDGVVRLHKVCVKETPSLAPVFEKYLEWASGAEALAGISGILDRCSAPQLQELQEVLLLLPPASIGVLGPMLLMLGGPAPRQMIAAVIGRQAARDVRAVEALLGHPDGRLPALSLRILSKIDDPAATQCIVRLTRHPSESIAAEALKAVVSKQVWMPEALFALVDSKSPAIRQRALDYLATRRCGKTERLMLDYLATKRFQSSEHGHLFACFRTLGSCGSAASIPFLDDTLAGGNLLSKLSKSARRQAAAIALRSLANREAEQILDKAAQSFFPGVRDAARASAGHRRRL